MIYDCHVVNKTPEHQVLTFFFSLHCVLVTVSCSTFCHPMDCGLPGFSVHGISQAKILGVGCNALGHLSNLGIEPGSPALQADSLPSEPPGKPILCISSGLISLLLHPNAAFFHNKWEFDQQTSPLCFPLSLTRVLTLGPVSNVLAILFGFLFFFF